MPPRIYLSPKFLTIRAYLCFMNSKLLRIGAILAALAVILGAFGAHKLKELIDEKALLNWETAVRYQFYHAVGIIIAAFVYPHRSEKSVSRAAYLFMAGILCFSGSVYLLSLRNLLDINVLWVGPITPIGGLMFVAGWLVLAFSTPVQKTIS
jgi:uncharacterized membrane protein YgdD (TMEM256/DUF423 family)